MEIAKFFNRVNIDVYLSLLHFEMLERYYMEAGNMA